MLNIIVCFFQLLPKGKVQARHSYKVCSHKKSLLISQPKKTAYSGLETLVLILRFEFSLGVFGPHTDQDYAGRRPALMEFFIVVISLIYTFNCNR